MPFNLNDVANTFYQQLDEAVPTSTSDVTTSRITIASFINTLTYVIRNLNEFSPYIQNAVFKVTSGTRQYQLPTDFIHEISIRYRGFPLKKSNTSDFTFLITAVTSYPWQYSIFYPGNSNSSALAATGNPYLIIDPPPSETSPVGTPPIFPGFNDPYLMVTYHARIPTDFTTSNYTTYIFNLPEEYHPLLADLCSAFVMSNEGKNSIYQQRFTEISKKLSAMNYYVQRFGEKNADTMQNVWWED
jgi:hypothetical protein